MKKKIRGLDTAWLENKKETDKHVVFLIHGCPDDPHTWDAQMDHLSRKGFSILAPWARGIGESEPAQDRHRYGLDAIALDHLEILRTFDLHAEKKVIVIAHDIGGIHAWNLARLLGDRLAALILVNAPELTQMARRFTHLSQLRKSWYIGFFQIPLVPEFLLKHWKPRVPGNASIAPFLNQYREAARAVPNALKDALNQKAPPLTAPVLVLWGKRDPFLDTPSMDELKPLANNVTMRVIDGSHWVHHNHSERVNALIDRFLEQQGIL